MTVGTLVRNVSNGSIGVIVKVSSSEYFSDPWCEVLYYNEQIVGTWGIGLEAV